MSAERSPTVKNKVYSEQTPNLFVYFCKKITFYKVIIPNTINVVCVFNVFCYHIDWYFLPSFQKLTSKLKQCNFNNQIENCSPPINWACFTFDYIVVGIDREDYDIVVRIKDMLILILYNYLFSLVFFVVTKFVSQIDLMRII